MKSVLVVLMLLLSRAAIAATDPAIQFRTVTNWPTIAVDFPTGNFIDITLRQNLAYAALTTGFHVFDISNPVLPDRIGGISIDPAEYHGHVQVSGDYAYIVGYARKALITVDIHDPRFPKEVARFAFDELPYGFAIKNQIAYVVFSTKTLVIDLSQSSAPKILNILPSETDYTGYGAIAIDGNLLFINRSIFDLRDGISPVRLGTLDREPSSPQIWLPESISIIGNYEILGQNTGVEIFDMSNPSSPKRTGQFLSWGGANSIAPFGTRALVCIRGKYGSELRMINLTDPSAPTWELVQLFNQSSTAAAAQGNRICVVGGDRLYVIDTTNPDKLLLLGGYYGSASSRNVTLIGTNAYVRVDDSLNGLHVLDVNTPTKPIALQSFMGIHPSQILWNGKNAVLINSNPAFQTVDISDPLSLTVLGTFPFPNQFNLGAALVAEHYVLVADGRSMHVIDIADPRNPSEAAQIMVQGLGITASGSHAFITGNGTISAVDISSIRSPLLLSSGIGAPEEHKASLLFDHYLFVAGQRWGSLTDVIQIYDVADPRVLNLVNEISLDVPVLGLNAAGKFLFVTKGNGVGAQQGPLEIMDLTAPTAPVSVASVPGAYAGTVSVAGDYIYAPHKTLGLEILKMVLPPVTATFHDHQLDLSWPTLPEHRYQLQYAENLFSESWLDFGASLVAKEPITHVGTVEGQLQRKTFFRIKLVD